MRVKMIKLD